MSIQAAAVTVQTSPTPIVTASGWVNLQNTGGNPVTLGGPNVAVGAGITLPASMTAPVPYRLYGSSSGAGDTLYGIASGGTSSVVFLGSSFSG